MRSAPTWPQSSPSPAPPWPPAATRWSPSWPPPTLDTVESAGIDGECLRLGYVGRSRAPSERVVHPLGLATKGRTWYLVADTDEGLRTFRIDRIETAERTGDPVVRPPGFELTTEWARIVARVERAMGSLFPDAADQAGSISYPVGAPWLAHPDSVPSRL